MHLLLTLLIALSINTAFAESLTVRERAALRRAHRMSGMALPALKKSRLGRTTKTLRTSPRRVHRSTDALVTEIIDGSLFKAMLGDGRTIGVHTLGAEAPLIQTGSKKQQCFAEESRESLAKLILGKTIAIRRDEDYQYDNDRNFLRYVELNGLDVGGYMIGSGMSFSDDENAHDRSTQYAAKEEEARDLEIGLWGGICDYHPNPSRTIEILE